MGKSWKLATIAGIEVRVHWSFALLLAAFGVMTHASTGSWWAAGLQTLMTLFVFGSVLAHEYGHALTARYFGIGTRRIVLWPLGGVAELESMPREPRRELLIAAAGPAVSVLLAAGFAGVAALAGAAGASLVASIVSTLAWANLGLALFNLLPVFPTDGGRIFRALLAARVGHRWATGFAARVGQVAAVGLGVYGLFAQPMLVLVAGFLFFAARSELWTTGLQGLSLARLWAGLRERWPRWRRDDGLPRPGVGFGQQGNPRAERGIWVEPSAWTSGISRPRLRIIKIVR